MHLYLCSINKGCYNKSKLKGMTNTKKCGSHRKTPVKRAKKVEEGRIKTNYSPAIPTHSKPHMLMNTGLAVSWNKQPSVSHAQSFLALPVNFS